MTTQAAQHFINGELEASVRETASLSPADGSVLGHYADADAAQGAQAAAARTAFDSSDWSRDRRLRHRVLNALADGIDRRTFAAPGECPRRTGKAVMPPVKTTGLPVSSILYPTAPLSAWMTGSVTYATVSPTRRPPHQATVRPGLSPCSPRRQGIPASGDATGRGVALRQEGRGAARRVSCPGRNTANRHRPTRSHGSACGRLRWRSHRSSGAPCTSARTPGGRPARRCRSGCRGRRG